MRNLTTVRTVTARELRKRLKEYETKYGVPSERLVEAFRDKQGRLRETRDFHDWTVLYSAYDLAMKSRPNIVTGMFPDERR